LICGYLESKPGCISQESVLRCHRESDKFKSSLKAAEAEASKLQRTISNLENDIGMPRLLIARIIVLRD